jgi:ABC-type uncharacterized transport system ATPase subunit
MEAKRAIEMHGIVKRFPLVIANNAVDFAADHGSIHALVGENGAGKTTLMSILYGLYQPDAGRIEVFGSPAHFTSQRQAIKAGSGMVSQHFRLVPSFTVAENIILGQEPGRRGVIDMGRAESEVREIGKGFALDVEPRDLVVNLPVGLQQRVEILKALYRQARVLILDEPTAVLTPQETRELFRTLRQLAEQGTTVVLVTHKLNEVMEISDRVSVMRAGRMVETMRTADTSPARIAEKMVGRPVLFRVNKTPAVPGAPLLEVYDLQANSARGIAAVRGVSFTVHQGEIVGIAGVQGNGQSELVEVLVGLRPATGGEIRLRGKVVTNMSTAARRRAGMAYIPEDRGLVGLSLDASLSENLLMGRQRRGPFRQGWRLRLRAVRRHALELIGNFDVRGATPTTAARALSGGNQQKIVLARELSSSPSLIIADQPSRGVDIGAIEFIHQTLVRMRNQGCGILLISADLQEIFALSDRIIVFYHGLVNGDLPASEATVETVGYLMAGVDRSAAPPAPEGA